MHKLRLNQPNLYQLDGVTLLGGVNRVSDDQLSALNRHDGFKNDVERGLIDIVEKNITPKQGALGDDNGNEASKEDKKSRRGRPKKKDQDETDVEVS